MLSSRIKELMKKTGIKTYAEFERKCGLANGTVGKWENSSYKPSIDYLIRISDHFAVSLDYLVGRSEDPVVSVSARGDVPTLSDEELELLNIFRSLSKKGKWVVLGEATRQSQFEKLDGDKGEAKEAK